MVTPVLDATAHVEFISQCRELKQFIGNYEFGPLSLPEQGTVDCLNYALDILIQSYDECVCIQSSEIEGNLDEAQAHLHDALNDLKRLDDHDDSAPMPPDPNDEHRLTAAQLVGV